MNALRKTAFHLWFRMSRSLTMGVRAAVTNAEGEVLLVRHTYVDGLYFPGGGVERRETARDALARELVEEAGVALEAPAELVGVFSNHRTFRNDHVLFFRARDWRAVAATSEGEIAEILWVDPLRPPEDATPATRRRLDELFGGAPVADHW